MFEKTTFVGEVSGTVEKQTFGKCPDGTLVICRALPENRGRGNCTHFSHQEVSLEELESGFIQKYNEEALAKHFLKNNLLRSTDKKIKSHADGNYITLEELERGSSKVADALKNEEFDLIAKFYEKYHRAIDGH